MDTITLQLTTMAHGGMALGRVGDKVVFVPYSLPGETVEARIVEDRGRWANAELVRVIKPSPDRVKPPCPHFGPPNHAEPRFLGESEASRRENGVLERQRGCGGCQWQHIAYPAQLRLKQAVVRDQFARVGKLPDVEVRPTIGMDDPWRFRNHVQFHVREDGRLGFRALREHTVIPIQECYIMMPAVEALWHSLDLDFPELRQVILRGDMGTDDQLVLLKTAFDTLPELEVDFPVSINLELSDGQTVTLIGSPWLMARVAWRDFRVSADAFFQVNTQMAEVMVRQVREALRPRGGQTLLDLYAGVGLFGLALADEMGQVIAIEEHPAAVRDWEINAHGLDNVRMLPGKVEDVLATVTDPIDLVVLDPPRTGAEPPALDALAALHPARIVYVSCDPATLARDAARLVGKGYRVRYVQPIDMFPQTWHIECVAVFEWEERGRKGGERPSPQSSPKGRGGERPSPQSSPKGRGGANPSPQPSPKGRGGANPSPQSSPRGRGRERPSPPSPPKGRGGKTPTTNRRGRRS